ncbi:hypothetical protein LTR17_007875 [Elasticomyces elasticus]|nr:hypothetical protein LTR17_007875 [Elasticomyces elasticus]
MTNRNTSTEVNNDANEIIELCSAVDDVLAHKDVLKAAIDWSTISQPDRWTERDRLILKSLLGDIEALGKTREGHGLLAVVQPRLDDDGRAAAEVFKIPELLEGILEHLSIPDLFRAEDTCRLFKDTISASPKLQHKLFRTSTCGERLRTLGYVGPFDSTDPWLGYSISCSSDLTKSIDPYIHIDAPEWNATPGSIAVFFNARFRSCSGKLPKLPERVLDMFVCQPIVTFQGASIACCPAVQRSLVTLGGCRLKDLYAVAGELLEEHKLCPNATIESLSKDGYVNNTVRFRSLVADYYPQPTQEGYIWESDGRLRADDPAWRPHVQRQRELNEHNAVLTAYMAAKDLAAQNGEPMFTLESFRARTASDSIAE